MGEDDRGGAGGAETSDIGAVAASSREGRMTAGRKRDAVLRLLRGEPLEIVARELAGRRRRRHATAPGPCPATSSRTLLGLASPAFSSRPRGQRLRRAPRPDAEENLLWVRTFRTVEEFRPALIDLRRTATGT